MCRWTLNTTVAIQKKGDGNDMDTDSGGETAPKVDSVESKVTSRQKSLAWSNFKKTEDSNKSKCNHCGQLITYRSPSGVNTSSMLNYMSRCKKLHPELDVEIVDGKKLKQATLFHQRKKDKSDEGVPCFIPYDKDDCRKGLTRMIIKNELPFRIVEREGFREFIYVLQPRFEIPSCRTVTRVASVYFLKKKKVEDVLSES